jgi:hypothetical protein
MGYLIAFSLSSDNLITFKKVHLVIQQIDWMIFLEDSFFYPVIISSYFINMFFLLKNLA